MGSIRSGAFAATDAWLSVNCGMCIVGDKVSFCACALAIDAGRICMHVGMLCVHACGNSFDAVVPSVDVDRNVRGMSAR